MVSVTAYGKTTENIQATGAMVNNTDWVFTCLNLKMFGMDYGRTVRNYNGLIHKKSKKLWLAHSNLTKL